MERRVVGIESDTTVALPLRCSSPGPYAQAIFLHIHDSIPHWEPNPAVFCSHQSAYRPTEQSRPLLAPDTQGLDEAVAYCKSAGSRSSLSVLHDSPAHTLYPTTFISASAAMIAAIQLQAGLAPADQQRVERLPIAEGMPDRGRSPAF
jgi:hypothetical protein